jgi:signal peptidase II
MKKLSRLFAPLQSGSRRERLVLFSSVAVAVAMLLLDQGTKIWVERSFKLHESRPIIDGWLSFTSVRNYGAAWSMLAGQTWLLLAVALAAFAAILYFFYKLAENYPERYLAEFLALSGILGNSIDRLWRGAVVDFIDIHYYTHWSYPVFNIADMAICTGVGIFVLSSFLRPDTSKKDERSDEDR